MVVKAALLFIYYVIFLLACIGVFLFFSYVIEYIGVHGWYNILCSFSMALFFVLIPLTISNGRNYE